MRERLLEIMFGLYLFAVVLGICAGFILLFYLLGGFIEWLFIGDPLNIMT